MLKKLVGREKIKITLEQKRRKRKLELEGMAAQEEQFNINIGNIEKSLNELPFWKNYIVLKIIHYCN